MLDLTKLKCLGDYFKYEYAEEEDNVIVNGKLYPFEITMDEQYPDDMCLRVMIDGEFYYFGD